MIDIEADLVILLVSHVKESFTLLKFVQILICHKQIPISMVNKAPDVQLTYIWYISSATEICYEIQIQIQIQIALFLSSQFVSMA